MADKNKVRYKAIMLIDDNEIDNIISTKMIEASGMAEHIFVHTGAKGAIEFLKNIERLPNEINSYLPEVIFLDIDMPLMDGFQFLEEFDKMSPKIKDFCKVVMLTSSINPQDMNKSLQSPYVKRYVNKPLSPEMLAKIDV